MVGAAAVLGGVTKMTGNLIESTYKAMRPLVQSWTNFLSAPKIITNNK